MQEAVFCLGVPCLLLFTHCRFFEVRRISSKDLNFVSSCYKVLSFCLIWLLGNSDSSIVPVLKYCSSLIILRVIIIFSLQI